MSQNEFDWLGSGVCFWESNPARAFNWARHLKKVGRGGARIEQPYAVGAVIDLGYCLDLISTTGIEFVKDAYADFKDYIDESGAKMPVNRGTDDLLQRYLDCAVINHIHSINKRDKRKPFETVRGVFLEGRASTTHPASTKKRTSRSAYAISRTSKVSFESRLSSSSPPSNFR